MHYYFIFSLIGFLSWAASVTAAVILICMKRYLSRRRRCRCAWIRSNNNNAGSDVQEDVTAQGEHIPMFSHTPPSEATTPSSACISTLQSESANTTETSFTSCSNKPLISPSSSSPESANTGSQTVKRALFESDRKVPSTTELPVVVWNN